MYRVRLLLASVLAPLVLAAFILMVGSEYTRLNAGLVVAAVLMANAFFWLCYLITLLIRNIKKLSKRVAPSLIFASVGLVLSCLFDAVGGAITHNFRWGWMLLDALTFPFVTWASYFIYISLRPRVLDASSAPSVSKSVRATRGSNT
jgi:hypothetical protein